MIQNRDLKKCRVRLANNRLSQYWYSAYGTAVTSIMPCHHVSNNLQVKLKVLIVYVEDFEQFEVVFQGPVSKTGKKTGDRTGLNQIKTGPQSQSLGGSKIERSQSF